MSQWRRRRSECVLGGVSRQCRGVLTLSFIGLFIILNSGTATAQSPSASATLYPPPEPTPAPEVRSGPSAIETKDSLWVCEGYAASPDPSEAAWAQLWLKVDGLTVAESGFSANYWCATYSVSGYTQPKDYDRIVSCEINVGTTCCGSASGSDSMTLFAELTPYVAVASDTENYIWNNVHRRDIWYQIWHANSAQAWTRRGTISETITIQSNPCEYEVQLGVGSVNARGQFLDSYYSPMEDPACIVTGTQQYRLSTSGYQMILAQAWRWDYTGVWRQ
jgi:hypothetical protein